MVFLLEQTSLINKEDRLLTLRLYVHYCDRKETLQLSQINTFSGSIKDRRRSEGHDSN